MADRAGHRLLLILGIVLGIGLLNRLLHAPSRNLLNQGRLLVFQRSVTVQADPDILVLFPVGLKEWILIGMGMDTRFPLIVDLAMALPTGLGLQARETFRNLLEWNRTGIIRPQPENHDRFDLGVIQIHKHRGQDTTEQNFDRSLHAARRA